MKIIVYGLGKNGKEFIEDILEKKNELEIEIVAATDSFSQETEFMKQNNVRFIESLNLCDEVFDYIVITPDKYFDEIKVFLVEQGIKDEKIKSIKEFGKTFGVLYCEICNNNILMWRRVGEWNDRRLCPVCGSIDRNRYVYHIIKCYTNLLDGRNHSVLHFAPEGFAEEIKEICGEDYITVDIAPGRADVVANITDLQFSDEQFEYIICNHVMEHVVDDKKGFEELERVLKPEGTLIFSVPVLWDRETLEDENIQSEEDRKKYYGQEDHVQEFP